MYRVQGRCGMPTGSSSGASCSSAIAATTRSCRSAGGSAHTAGSASAPWARSISASSAGVSSSSAIGPSFECAQVSEHARQSAVCPEGARLHRADRDRELLGDLAVGELVEVLHPDQLALVARELVERAAYLCD